MLLIAGGCIIITKVGGGELAMDSRRVLPTGGRSEGKEKSLSTLLRVVRK